MKESHIILKQYVTNLRVAGRKSTLLGIGPVSHLVLEATFEACKKYDCPPIFIASRNQVDLEKFGHGYLMGGMDQKSFVGTIRKIQSEVGYEGPVYICRDHGGPWQRNVELDEKYSVEKAFEIGKESFRADIEAGFNYIHIDPTKCPHPFTQEDLCEWTVDILEYCEEQRKIMGKEPVDYEVGTEDIQGGLTENDTYESFLKNLTKSLEKKNLPLPTCVVGQTGTLCRADRNMGHFSKEQTAELVQIASKYGVGLKEHNGDYMGVVSCREHPGIGVVGMNVAPEFGLVETEACLHLADLEEKLLQDGWIDSEQYSNFRDLILEKTFSDSPWTKWMMDDVKALDPNVVRDDKFLRILIARVCGHYVYDDETVKEARQKLYGNINNFKVVEDAERFVIEKIRDSIEFYFKPFQLEGANAVAIGGNLDTK